MAYNSDQNRRIQPFLSFVAVRMANCVKIKMNGKVTRLRSLKVGNLAIIIFKLDVKKSRDFTFNVRRTRDNYTSRNRIFQRRRLCQDLQTS